jgi:hypothetical protein
MIYFSRNYFFFGQIYTYKNQKFQNFPSFFCHQVPNLHPKKITAYKPQLFVKKITFSCNVGTIGFFFFFWNFFFCQSDDHLYNNFIKWQLISGNIIAKSVSNVQNHNKVILSNGFNYYFWEKIANKKRRLLLTANNWTSSFNKASHAKDTQNSSRQATGCQMDHCRPPSATNEC